VLRLVVVLAFIVTLLSPCSLLASADYLSRPGTVGHTLSLPDNTQVTLDSMMIEWMSGSWIFVRDPWRGSAILPVHANALLDRWMTVEITGTTATIDGRRVVLASRIRVYTDSRSRPMPPFPKGLTSPKIGRICPKSRLG